MSNKLKSSSAPPSTTPASNASEADILATTRKILSKGWSVENEVPAYYTVKKNLLKKYSLYSFNRHKKSIQNEIEDFHKRMEVARPKRDNNKPPIRVEGEKHPKMPKRGKYPPIRVEGETKSNKVSTEPPPYGRHTIPNWVKEDEPLNYIKNTTKVVPDGTVLYVEVWGGSLRGNRNVAPIIIKPLEGEEDEVRTTARWMNGIVIYEPFTIKCVMLDGTNQDARWLEESVWNGNVRVLEIIGHNPDPNNLMEGSILGIQSIRDRISLLPLPLNKFADLIRKKLKKEYIDKLKKSAAIHSEFDVFPGNEYMLEGRGFKMLKKEYSDGMNYSSGEEEEEKKQTVSDWLKTLNLETKIEIRSADDIAAEYNLNSFETGCEKAVEAFLLKLLDTEMIDIDRRYMGIERLEKILLKHPTSFQQIFCFDFSPDDIKKIKLALAKRKQEEEKSYDHDDNQAQQMLLNSFASTPHQTDTEGNASITNDMLGGRKRSRKHHRKRSRKSRRKSRRKRRKKRTKKRKKNRTRI